jgi:N-acetylglucosamine kinase-like BadF-type ATPase
MAVDSSGSILYQGHSGAANLATTPEQRLRRNLIHAVEGCPGADYVCGCFAGLVSDPIRMVGLQHLKYVFPDAVVRAEPDYTAALYACPPGTDICVIAGTGSLVASRVDGQIVKSGGGGYILGDEGSSYQYGRELVLQYLRYPSESTQTARAAIAEFLKTSDPGEIISTVYRSGTPAPLLGKLARALGQDAAESQPYAVASVRRHMDDLAEIVRIHVKRFLPEQSRISICLSGGLWKAGPIFKDAFASALRNTLSKRELTITRITKPPLHGAVELAREMMIGN